ncbi:hypothetical protein Tco_0693819 [Tanacetum coccineum]
MLRERTTINHRAAAMPRRGSAAVDEDPAVLSPYSIYKSQGRKHFVTSAVGKRKRFDFLADFVPEKVKADDALKGVPTDQ